MVRYTPAAQLAFEDFSVPSFQKLDPDNRWVRLAAIVPWDQLALVLAASPTAPDLRAGGRPTLDLRLVLAALLVQRIENLSDERTVTLVTENVYVQYFCGLAGFRTRRPFEASSLTHWRSWLGDRGAAELADALATILEERLPESPEPPEPPEPSESPESSEPSESSESSESDALGPNRGTLLIDATCAPADVTFPTDTGLLNAARLSAEAIVDRLWVRGPVLAPEAYAEFDAKPRTYRHEAARGFASFSKRRRPGTKRIRRCRRRQLQYLERDLRHVDALLTALVTPAGLPDGGLLADDLTEVLTAREWKRLRVCHEVARQQRLMHETRARKCADRIVSLSQPHIRPIVRGKAGARVEFGPKFDVSLVAGIARVERFEYDAYHEGLSAVAACERYAARRGYYPARVLADGAYTRDRGLRAYFTSRGIVPSAAPLGRPPKDPDALAAYEAAKGAPGERNEIEGWFGVCKRRYGMARLSCRKAASTAGEVYLRSMVMNLMTALRALLRWCLARVYEVQGAISWPDGQMEMALREIIYARTESYRSRTWANPINQ